MSLKVWLSFTHCGNKYDRASLSRPTFVSCSIFMRCGCQWCKNATQDVPWKCTFLTLLPTKPVCTVHSYQAAKNVGCICTGRSWLHWEPGQRWNAHAVETRNLPGIRYFFTFLDWREQLCFFHEMNWASEKKAWLLVVDTRKCLEPQRTSQHIALHQDRFHLVYPFVNSCRSQLTQQLLSCALLQGSCWSDLKQWICVWCCIQMCYLCMCWVLEVLATPQSRWNVPVAAWVTHLY